MLALLGMGADGARLRCLGMWRSVWEGRVRYTALGGPYPHRCHPSHTPTFVQATHANSGVVRKQFDRKFKLAQMELNFLRKVILGADPAN